MIKLMHFSFQKPLYLVFLLINYILVCAIFTNISTQKKYSSNSSRIIKCPLNCLRLSKKSIQRGFYRLNHQRIIGLPIFCFVVSLVKEKQQETRYRNAQRRINLLHLKTFDLCTRGQTIKLKFSGFRPCLRVCASTVPSCLKQIQMNLLPTVDSI